jgi:glycosyltransferase involved in cell wall biosynthesis
VANADPKDVTSNKRQTFSLFISLNGSLASEGKTVGGGDVVLFKFIALSKLQPDIMIPECGRSFVATSGKLYLTASHGSLSTFGIVWTFFVRILQAIWQSFQNRKVYDVALAASPFGVDVIPVWFWKARRKGAVIYHLLPERKAINLETWIRFKLAAIEQWVILKVLRAACDYLVAGNEHTKQQLQAIMPGKTMFILPAGIDAPSMDRIATAPKDPNLGCFVGRLVSQKGIFDLLKIMAELARSHPEFKLVIAGSGPEKDFFISEIQRQKLTNIQLAGFVSEEQKFTLLKKSKYFFFPSYEEGWGIALAEALYCECLCLCYELPHYRFIFGDFPIYTRLGDAEDFVRAFRQSGEVSSKQKEFIRQYDDPLIVQQLAGHLAGLVKNR